MVVLGRASFWLPLYRPGLDGFLARRWSVLPGLANDRPDADKLLVAGCLIAFMICGSRPVGIFSARTSDRFPGRCWCVRAGTCGPDRRGHAANPNGKSGKRPSKMLAIAALIVWIFSARPIGR